MAWAVDYTDTALKQLRKLDRQIALRVLDFMDERVAANANPHALGKALSGPVLGSFWRYRIGNCRVICDIQDHRLRVLVIEVGLRKNVYD